MLQPLIADCATASAGSLQLRFEQEWSQERIGAELGVSQMQISRLLRETLDKLRNALSEQTGPVRAAA